MNKETRDFLPEEAIDWIAKHNPGTMKGVFHGRICLITNISPEDLTLPKDWYYTTKNGITNKHNSSTGLYHCIEIVQY